MAPEITCRVELGEERALGFGGERWVKDLETLIAEIRSGREYFVQISAARVRVTVAEQDGSSYLRTDPGSMPENGLLALPICGDRPDRAR